MSRWNFRRSRANLQVKWRFAMKKTRYQLLFTRGPLKGLRHEVKEGEFHLGRSTTCEICIPDPGLSRKHCLSRCPKAASASSTWPA